MSDAIRRPEWHNCPGFARSWEALRYQSLDPRNSDVETGAVLSAARALGSARVVKVDHNYLISVREAIVRSVGRLSTAGVARELRLPFEHLFVEISNPGPGPGGLLLQRPEGSSLLHVIPFMQMERRSDEWAVFGEGVITADDVSGNKELRVWFARLRGWDMREELDKHTNYGLSLARTLLYLLQSANVYLDGEPLPRQQRRDAARRDREIPLTIQIKRGGKKPIDRGGTVDWSHQWETAAHFQHHDKGPVWKALSTDPRNVMVVDGRECVRVWNPGCIKGPESKPFIPKVRDAQKLVAVGGDHS